MLWPHTTIIVKGQGFSKEMYFAADFFPMISVIYNDSSAKDIQKQNHI